jgi:hypothetical protein
MATKENAALALIDEKAISLPALNKELLASMQEEMEGMDLAFDRIKIPSGGGIAYEVPGDDPENPDAEKEVFGVIIDHHPINAYWAAAYSGEKNPPDCSSMDGIVGTDRETGEIKTCVTCPKNQYGSAENGGGKACKNMRRVYFTRPDYLFPMLLVLPPTSLRNFNDYIKRSIIGKNRRSFDILTKFTLVKDKNAGGIVYSKALFSPAGALPEGLKAQTAAYSQEIKAYTRTIEVSQGDYTTDAAAPEIY